MFILQRYYLREFFKLLSLISLGLALIFSILDLVDKIDDFMPSRPSLGSLFLYAFYNFPKYLLYLMPAALLTCTLFIFSHASRNKELVAIRATGGRLRILLYPFIVTGMVLSVFAFLLGEIVVPDFSKRSHELKDTLMRKEQKLTFKEGTLWLRGTDGSPVRIELYIPEKRLAKGVSIFIYGKELLKKRIEAEEAEWKYAGSSEGIWRLRNVTAYDIEEDKIYIMPEMDYPYLEPPDFFSEGIRKPEEMGIGELYRYTARLKSAGFRNIKLIVDLHSKISYPLANFFMILLGISLSIRGKAGGGLFAVGLGLLISIVYWFAYTMMLSMGYAGIVPPLIATWFVPVVFGGIAVYLFSKVPE